MFIKMKRSQSCKSGVYRCGVIYEIDEKKKAQTDDVAQMLARGFAVKLSKKDIGALQESQAADVAAKKAADDKAEAEAKKQVADDELAKKAADDEAAKKAAK